MPTVNQEASQGEACQASRPVNRPGAMGPRNPQAPYYRARYYDPNLGRFLGEDPLQFRAGADFYAYVGNSAPNFRDPLGLCRKVCPRSGIAPDPGFYADLGNSANWMQNDVNLFPFRRGGYLDAQADGASPDYGNYVFGVYMNAAGYSLSFTLSAANAYGAARSHYRPDTPMDSKYKHIPAANVKNITAGFNDNRNGSLCTISQ